MSGFAHGCKDRVALSVEELDAPLHCCTTFFLLGTLHAEQNLMVLSIKLLHLCSFVTWLISLIIDIFKMVLWGWRDSLVA